MKRSSTFLIHFRTSNFSTVKTTCNQHLNAFCTSTHCISNGHLDSTTICNLTFNLASDIVGNNYSIKFRTLNLKDINLHILIGDLLQLFFQLINFLTTLANDYTRTSRANSNRNKFQRTLNNNARYTCLREASIQILTNFAILK